MQRVSKLASDRERSVTDQEADNRAEAGREGWRVARVFSEQQSASRFARKRREDWARLVGDLEAHVYGPSQVVVLWESSRGDRTPESWFRFLSACRESGTLIHVTSHRRTYDMDIGRDWRTLAEDGVRSAAESEETSERSRRGIRTNVIDGKPHGKIPFGYERIYDARTKKLAEQREHPERGPVVREIKQRIAAGDPVKVIVRDLNERRVPTLSGVPWTHQTVRQIAVNPVYIGVRVWRPRRGGLEEYPGSWPAIVSEETHYGAVAVLRANKTAGRRPARDKYLLSFIATCGKCGKHLAGAISEHGVMPGYRCPSGCTMTRVPWLDAFIERLVIRKLSEPGTYETLTAPDDGWRAQARGEAAALDARLKEAYDAYSNARISMEGLVDIEAALKPRLEAVRRRLEAVAVSGPVKAVLASAEDNIAVRWEAAPIAARKAVVRYLFGYIRLHPGMPGAPRGSRARLDTTRIEWDWREELRLGGTAADRGERLRVGEGIAGRRHRLAGLPREYRLP